MNIKTLPRELINLNLRAARVPVTLIARATRQDEGLGGGALTLAFDNAEATVKEALGGFLSDEGLLSDARLQRARLAKLREAASNKVVAEQQHAVAEQRFEQGIDNAESRKQQVEQSARQREQQLEREKAQAKQKVAAEAARKEQAAAKAAADRQARIDADKRAADLRRLEAEERAVTEKQRSLAAQARVAEIDAAAKATKRIRTAK